MQGLRDDVGGVSTRSAKHAVDLLLDNTIHVLPQRDHHRVG